MLTVSPIATYIVLCYYDLINMPCTHSFHAHNLFANVAFYGPRATVGSERHGAPIGAMAGPTMRIDAPDSRSSPKRTSPVRGRVAWKLRILKPSARAPQMDTRAHAQGSQPTIPTGN